MATMDRVVGVVVAINGKMEMADVYESTALFKKLWPKLLKSYALDAIGVADKDNACKVCDVADAVKFLDEVREANVAKTDEKGGLIVTARSSETVESFSAGMGEMAGFAGSVHSAGLAVYNAYPISLRWPPEAASGGKSGGFHVTLSVGR